MPAVRGLYLMKSTTRDMGRPSALMSCGGMRDTGISDWSIGLATHSSSDFQ